MPRAVMWPAIWPARCARTALPSIAPCFTRRARPRGSSAACVRALNQGIVDFALFFSPRTAAIFVRLADRAGVAEALRPITAISISAAADAALGTLRFRERHIAERPDQPSLLAALDRMLAERRRA